MLSAGMSPDMLYRFPLWVVGIAMAAGAIGSSLLLGPVVGRLVSVDTRRRHNVLTGGAPVVSVKRFEVESPDRRPYSRPFPVAPCAFSGRSICYFSFRRAV